MKKHHFVYHLTRNIIVGFCVTACALSLGMLGYHFLENLSWIDSFLNAAMILSGMGPATIMQTTGGKLFAGIYALFSGLVFIALIALIFTPIIHKVFRQIHLERK